MILRCSPLSQPTFVAISAFLRHLSSRDPPLILLSSLPSRPPFLPCYIIIVFALTPMSFPTPPYNLYNYNSNMMYPQYGWNMPGVGMQQGMWPGAPGAPGGGGAMSPGMTPQAPAGPTPTAASGDTRQAYDPSKSKSSWLGHYGYLEGRGESSPT